MDSLGVIYVRVSSDLQMKKGSGLESQEISCREYAKTKNIDIVSVFSDGGVSGKYLSRESLDAMIAYLKNENKHYTKIGYVLTDDIDRISRDVVNWWHLKTTIESTGAKILSLKQNLENTPEGVLQQNIVMAFKQYERENNARRVRDRQRSKMLDGYRPLYPPQGYKHIVGSNGKKILDLVNPDATILKEALELFASGMFVTKEDLRRYLKEQHFSTRQTKGVTRSFIDRLLEERMLLFYAGYIHYIPWDVNMIEAKHPAIIDKSVVYRIRERLHPKVLYKKYTYSDIDHKVPLRSVLLCDSCGHPFTGGPSRSKTGKLYYYYTCKQKGCKNYGKSFNVDKVQEEFEQSLNQLAVKKSVVSLLKKVVEKFYEMRSKEQIRNNSNIEKEIKDLNNQIEQLQERILGTSDTQIISLYERKLRDILDKKHIVESSGDIKEENIIDNPVKLIEEVRNILEKPLEYWKELELEQKRLLVKVRFNNNLSYGKISGLQTPEISYIHRDFSLLGRSNFVNLDQRSKFLNSEVGNMKRY